MRYTISLSYDGSTTCGWQSQPNVPTVQDSLETALGKLLGVENIRITGAGRTDTGVNAVNYMAHFDFDGLLPFTLDELTYKFCAILPPQIVVHNVCEAPSDSFHARFDAVSRTYRYFMHFQKNPFIERYSCRLWYKLDIDAMNKACSYMLGSHDFSCFEKTGGSNATSICNVTKALVEHYTPDCETLLGYPKGEYMVFTITADRFLRNMVRAAVGTLIEVGRGRRKPEWVEALIANGTRSDAGESVIGEALFLTDIKY